MWVKEITLAQFRNFESLQTKLSPGINIVYGDNANGKTNFIEAIYFCAMGRSQRAGSDRELIRFGAKESHLQALIDREGIRCAIDVHLFSDARKKGIALDHVPIRKLNQLFGQLLVVIFTPEDLRIVKSGPFERRTFMDMELCQLSPPYYHYLRLYHQALKQRNSLLKKLKGAVGEQGKTLAETLFVWNAPLCKYGRQLMAHRADFVQRLEALAQAIHADITANTERLTLTYRPQVPEAGQYEEKLRRSTERDIILGSTTIGIHKDDLLFAINEKDLRTYGSQGQQRTAALSVKLAEIELIKTKTRHTPVLLLDDVLSELDEKRQSYLFKHIKNVQTILTCTGIEDVIRKLKQEENVKILKMENGNLKGDS